MLECLPYVKRVLEDDRLELFNNAAEQAIRPFAIGRKNWLFGNTLRGAEASMGIYLVVRTMLERSDTRGLYRVAIGGDAQDRGPRGHGTEVIRVVVARDAGQVPHSGRGGREADGRRLLRRRRAGYLRRGPGYVGPSAGNGRGPFSVSIRAAFATYVQGVLGSVMTDFRT